MALWGTTAIHCSWNPHLPSSHRHEVCLLVLLDFDTQPGETEKTPVHCLYDPRSLLAPCFCGSSPLLAVRIGFCVTGSCFPAARLRSDTSQLLISITSGLTGPNYLFLLQGMWTTTKKKQPNPNKQITQFLRMHYLSFPALKGATAGLITLPSPMFQQSKILLELSSSNSAASWSCAYISLWLSHLPFYPFATEPQTTYQKSMPLLGIFECMKISWRILDSGSSSHTTLHDILEISAFLSYMVMHTVHLRLEYGPEEQHALLSLQLTRHSLFLWALHFQEIQLHCLATTRQISQDGSSLRVAIPTFRRASIHWVMLTWSACPAGNWAFPNQVGSPQPFTFLSSVPIIPACCFVTVLHQPPVPVNIPEHSWD